MTTLQAVIGWSVAIAAAVSISGSAPSARSSQPDSSGFSFDGPVSPEADPPCFDNATRYVDCGNGTVTDTATGLVWLQDAGCLRPSDWAAANRAASRLKHGRCGLRDHSRRGDWRLPSNAEWTAMVAAARTHPLLLCTNPTLTDDSGAACFGSGSTSSFSNVLPEGYWSSTTSSQSAGLLPDGTKAGTINLLNGFLASFFDKSCCPQHVWPVRGH